jgi:hypothetical protein
MTNFYIEKHPIENGDSISLVGNGALVENKKIHRLSFIPDTWKDRIQELRVQHVENRFTALADDKHRKIGKFLIPHLH